MTFELDEKNGKSEEQRRKTESKSSYFLELKVYTWVRGGRGWEEVELGGAEWK